MRNKVYTQSQIDAIHNNLPYSTKQAAAKHVGILLPALSRYLNLKKDGQYRMPEHIYNKIVEFINLKKSNNGNVATSEVQEKKQGDWIMGRDYPSDGRV